MTDQELLQVIRTALQEEINPLNKRLDHIDKQLEALEEGQTEIRGGVNTLLDWADKVGGSISFPLPKIAE